MSHTSSISHNGRSFWAYDVALGILLKYMIDAAEPRAASTDDVWLAKQIAYWRLVAGIGSGCYGIETEKDWTPAQVENFIELIDSACRALSERRQIAAAEITDWPILDELRLHTRGAEIIETWPIVELGEAIIALVKETLPPAPTDTWWFFGLSTGRSTIAMRVPEDHERMGDAI